MLFTKIEKSYDHRAKHEIHTDFKKEIAHCHRPENADACAVHTDRRRDLGNAIKEKEHATEHEYTRIHHRADQCRCKNRYVTIDLCKKLISKACRKTACNALYKHGCKRAENVKCQEKVCAAACQNDHAKDKTEPSAHRRATDCRTDYDRDDVTDLPESELETDGGVETNGGCASVIGVTLGVLPLAIATTFALRKKKD